MQVYECMCAHMYIRIKIQSNARMYVHVYPYTLGPSPHSLVALCDKTATRQIYYA